ncbi:hypothetical protein KW791_02205 [Candidatus Parcubacteria bacterium]|nr:hypothetical protein [Candidatus Parcubacteria bacterium]
MEKIFIKPVSKEIILKGAAKEGSSDIFSYDYESDHAKRKLGNLFIVGNVQVSGEPQDDLDVGYMTNLIASLAKREYYAKSDSSPKEAFTAALKKINGVVEEFFKKQDTKINLGIFAIAGEQIHISKLGKFKIILSRDERNVDILNNVDLFDTESTQEKEFSNIVSGKVIEGDRILAFYPSRSITAREKSIKDQLLKSSQDQFVTNIKNIKDQKKDFACAAVHIQIEKAKEAAHVEAPQPKELQQSEEELTPESEPLEVQLADTELAKSVEDMKESKSEVEMDKPNPPLKIKKAISIHHEIPKIIPAEFSLGKRSNVFLKQVRRVVENMNINPKNRYVALGGLAVLVIGGALVAKSFFFIDPAVKQLNSIVSEAQSNIKLAQTKVTQQDVSGARELLMSTLSSIVSNETQNGPSKKTESTKAEIMNVLDGIDQATDAAPSVVFDMPQNSGQLQLIYPAKEGLFVYVSGDKNYLAKISAGEMGTQHEVPSAVKPESIFGSENYIALLDSTAKKIASFSVKKSTFSTTSLGLTSLVGSDIYQDNLYALVGDTITKVTDAAAGHTDSVAWLKSGTVPSGAQLITVDGKVYVLSSNGTLTTYFKGAKTSETSTSVSVNASSLMLTTTDSPNLYIVNKSLGRIYVIKKETGSLVKTLKTGATGITSAGLMADGTIYIISNNKVWKIQ